MNKKFIQQIKAISKLKKQGSVIMISMILLASMMAVVFIFSSTLRASLKSSKINQDTIISYYAAEAGVEKALYNILILGDSLPTSLGEMFTGTLDNGVVYTVDCISTSPTKIRSSAAYQNVYRSVQLDF